MLKITKIMVVKNKVSKTSNPVKVEYITAT